VENNQTRLEAVSDRITDYFSKVFGGRRSPLNGAIYFPFVTNSPYAIRQICWLKLLSATELQRESSQL
jgi:hypothetical protein